MHLNVPIVFIRIKTKITTVINIQQAKMLHTENGISIYDRKGYENARQWINAL